MGKKTKMKEIMAHLEDHKKERIEALKDNQAALNEIVEEHNKKKAELEAKIEGMYKKRYDLQYDERNAIVNELIEIGQVSSKGVPDFWLTVLKKNNLLNAEISEPDEGALQFLRDIRWCRTDGNPKSFKLVFFFDEDNPYFANDILSITYDIRVGTENETTLDSVGGVDIIWKDRKGIKDGSSFFDLFKPSPQRKVNAEIDDDEELAYHLERALHIGLTIRDKIIPRAMDWFTTKATFDFQIDHEQDEDVVEG